MSAIFGIVGTIASSELDEMAQRLRHRGESACWREVASGVYLGQIAEQPLAPYADRAAAVVIDASTAAGNGAHRRVLRGFLQRRRARDLDSSPTIPFALAAWDRASRTMLLARDFLGLKPLYYCRLPRSGIAFATEYKALLAIEAVPAIVDRAALCHLQTYKAVPPGRTLLAGISAVPPGVILRLDRDGQVLGHDRMREIRLTVQPMSEQQACEQLREKLVTATAPLVRGRRRIGIALSGGIDSLSVAHLARKCAPDAELVAFTTGQSDSDPEVRRAAAAMTALDGRHEPIVVSNEDLAAQLPRAVWHLEDPIGRSETFQFFALARLAREHGFDCLLTGMGADLLFAGMPRHKVLWMAERVPALRGPLLEFFSATQDGVMPRSWAAQLMMRLYYRGTLPAVPRVIDALPFPAADLVAAPGPEFLNRCLMLDGQEPTSRTLARIERPLQAFGIDYASPYLDKSVIELAFTIPSALKIRRGVQKYVLRQAMQPLMAPALRAAPKELMRMAQNGAFQATLQRLADRYVSFERVRHRGLFDPADVERIRAACRGRYHPETAMRLWTLIVTEMWAEIFLDARGRCPDPTRAAGAAVRPREAHPVPALPPA